MLDDLAKQPGRTVFFHQQDWRTNHAPLILLPWVVTSRIRYLRPTCGILSILRLKTAAAAPSKFSLNGHLLLCSSISPLFLFLFSPRPPTR